MVEQMDPAAGVRHESCGFLYCKLCVENTVAYQFTGIAVQYKDVKEYVYHSKLLRIFTLYDNVLFLA